MENLSGTGLSVSLTLNALEAQNDGRSTSDPISINYRWQPTYGTSANQINVLWSDKRTISSPEELDIYGVLEDAFGDTVNCAKVRGLLIINHDTAAGKDLEVGGAGSNPFWSFLGADDQTLIVRAGGIDLKFAPLDGFAAGATADKLRIAPSSGSITYTIAILGTTV